MIDDSTKNLCKKKGYCEWMYNLNTKKSHQSHENIVKGHILSLITKQLLLDNVLSMFTLQIITSPGPPYTQLKYQ